MYHYKKMFLQSSCRFVSSDSYCSSSPCRNFYRSDIVALVYYILNSTGSLVDVKLTALRTAAIGLTLSVSLNSSMHIIRKLWKPQESLFEGLSEK